MISDHHFKLACELQAQTFKATGAFGLECNRALFNAAFAAANEVRDGLGPHSAHLVPSGTGSGKTTFTVSLIAACHRTRNDYTAAIVTPTINAAQQVHDMLALLIPASEIAIHTSAHASLSAAREHAGEIARYVEASGPTSQDHLARCRVVVCTHEAWIHEGLSGDSKGIRYHLKGPRSNVFVDEFPDTVRIAVHAPSAFHELADELERFDLTRETSGGVRSFARTLDKTVTESGSRFAAVPILTDDSAKELSSLLPAPELDSGTNSLATSIKALTSVTQGRGFVARTGPQTDSDAGQKRVVTFADVFRAQPGLVILDATGELEPRVKHGTEVEVQRVPRAVYPHLETMHLTVPKAFDGIAVTRMSRDLVADYARWIVSEIMRANALCEQTLVVVHKNAEARVRTEIARRADDASVPFITHWGCDVGSNAYRACGNVFLFGEFHQPRYAYLAKWLGSAGRTAHPAELRAATGQRTTGGVKDVEAAHLLRCFKQMACRGTARDVGPDGIAAPMRLYTTMERPREI